MALESTQPLTEMTTRGKCVRLTTLPFSCADCLEILGASNSWSPKGLSRPIEGLIFFIILRIRSIRKGHHFRCVRSVIVSISATVPDIRVYVQ
jgi:hypothetical protein